ncbi:YfbR-like 5'-deoxynucleotidase [Undibacterium sp. SXout20W]|uniref:YfbR-like 5'-deoxynucleotidase n=1 Tax=Undibacterium sp. SXout20W TaxID=3413051 RepID=UPI003BF38E8A
MKPIILTASGSYFDLRAPMLSRIDIDTIAHALSNICRFTGHTREFYSVAQHSYHASFLVPEEYALEALLHDAAEAYIGDVATPLKRQLPDYAGIESKVEQAIAAHFNLTLPMSEHVHRADQIMLATEKRDLMPESEDWFAGTDIQPMPTKLVPVAPTMAKRLFLDRFHHLIVMNEIAQGEAA